MTCVAETLKLKANKMQKSVSRNKRQVTNGKHIVAQIKKYVLEQD